tara:strand:+ start:327 stop:803 length:477 start_codon:yes stop_codon:yes gene_type:complete
MFAEAMAGIALVKTSVEFIKSNIDTAKDIGDIAGAIDGLFRGNDEVQKSRNKKSGMGVGDQFGIKTVAQEVIDARIAAEQMQEMKTMINMRFGPDTWQSIVDERARRIQEAKEAEKKARIEARRQAAEQMENIKMALTILAVVGVMAFALVGTIYFAT